MFLNALLLTCVNSHSAIAGSLEIKLFYLLFKSIRPLISLNSTFFLYMYLFFSLDPTLVTGLALCWSWEIDYAAETRNKNGAGGRDTRIPYYANPRVILKTNRCLLSPYISVSYVSVSRENETFNVSTPMMDLILNNSQRMEALWLYQEKKAKAKGFLDQYW